MQNGQNPNHAKNLDDIQAFYAGKNAQIDVSRPLPFRQILLEIQPESTELAITCAPETGVLQMGMRIGGKNYGKITAKVEQENISIIDADDHFLRISNDTRDQWGNVLTTYIHLFYTIMHFILDFQQSQRQIAEKAENTKNPLKGEATLKGSTSEIFGTFQKIPQKSKRARKSTPPTC